jgi:hypothetical protein
MAKMKHYLLILLVLLILAGLAAAAAMRVPIGVSHRARVSIGAAQATSGGAAPATHNDFWWRRRH